MNGHKLLEIATYAGQILLESGAETYRVEETIGKIALAFGATDTETFATPTGIIVSFTYKNELYSIVKRIKKRGIDLNKIDKINDLSRRIQNNPVDLDELHLTLKKIHNGQTYTEIHRYISSALIAGVFAVIYGGNIYDFFAGLIVGCGLNYITLNLKILSLNTFFINCVGGAFAATIAILLSYIGITHNINETIIGSIMLLVPGVAITNAARDIIAGDILAGLTRASEAFLIAVSIAVGTGFVISIWINLLGGKL